MQRNNQEFNESVCANYMPQSYALNEVLRLSYCVIHVS